MKQFARLQEPVDISTQPILFFQRGRFEIPFERLCEAKRHWR